MANKKKIKIKDKRVRSILRGPLFWIVVALVTVVIFGRISNTGQTWTDVSTSTILSDIAVAWIAD